MADPFLNVRDLSVGYNQRATLEHVSFMLQEGAFTFVLGANGCGKSALLKTIAHVLKPLRGEIIWRDANVRLGYVPQRHAIDQIYLLSALEIVLMGAAAQRGAGKPLRGTDRDRARSLLHTAAGDVEKAQFAQLSGGQQQRVLIARALMTEPDLLLLDEPTSGVDANASQGILEWLRELNATGLTTLLVTHDLPQIRQFASDVLWIARDRLHEGKIHELNAPGKLEEILLG